MLPVRATIIVAAVAMIVGAAALAARARSAAPPPPPHAPPAVVAPPIAAVPSQSPAIAAPAAAPAPLQAWRAVERRVPLPLPDAIPMDLDGDGVAEDWEAVHDSCGTGGCVFRVYLSRTGRFAGEVEGHDFFVLPTKRGAPPEILAIWYLGNQLTPTTYRFAHGRLAERHGRSAQRRDQ